MTSDRPRLKRGAPFGNRNALKHGLYVRRRSASRPPRTPAPAAVEPPPPIEDESEPPLPSEDESESPLPAEDESYLPLSLSYEIALLRIQYSKLFFSATRTIDYEDLGGILRNMAFGAIAITRLVMAQEYLLQEDTPQIDDYWWKVIQEQVLARDRGHDARVAEAAKVPIVFPDLEADYPGIHYWVNKRGIDVRDIRHLLPPVHTYRTNPKNAAANPAPPPAPEDQPPPEK